MTIQIEVQFSEYVRNVRASATNATVLAIRLEKAAPGDLNADQRRALRTMLQRAAAVQSVQSERDRLAPSKVRPVLMLAANDWTALDDALRAVGRLPADVGDRGVRAQVLEASLFPEGVSFMQADADAAWGESKRRLDRIADEGLEDEIEELVGKHFLVAIRKSTARLADAIGIGKTSRTAPSSTALADALAAFGRSVGAYGRTMVATVDEEDPASVERFLAAMAPLDAHRASTSRTRGEGSEPPEPPLEPPPEPSAPPDPVPAPA